MALPCGYSHEKHLTSVQFRALGMKYTEIQKDNYDEDGNFSTYL